jgi:XTP/dITP diphosphohydrolase
MHAPVGAGGFGYDPVFWVPEFAASMAELSSAQKHSISHRGRAAVQLARLLGATSARRAGE